jgi:organic radical activating enzyme
MTDEQFCKIYSSYYGDEIDKVGQLVQEVLSGEELKEMIEFFIKHTKDEKIEDYFGTKTAIKCENKQQWDKICELTKANSKYLYSAAKDGLFDLNTVGNYWSVTNEFKLIEQGYTILHCDSFVNEK